MTISKDRVKPSPRPDSWKLNEIFATGVVIGTYLALVTVLFYWIIVDTDFFEVSNLFFFYGYFDSKDVIKKMFSFLSFLHSILMYLIQFATADPLSCEIFIEQHRKSFFCCIFASQHYQPSSHICHT